MTAAPSLAVVTAAYGGAQYVPYGLPRAGSPREAVLVTDVVARPSPGWGPVVEPRPHLTPRVAAKVPKCRPDWYTDAQVTVWIDAQFEVLSPRFFTWCLTAVTSERPVALLPHPRRTTLTAEAEAGAGGEGRGRFREQLGRQQVVHYLDEGGYPDDWGLWCGGLVVRWMSPQVVEMGRRWMEEVTRWSAHDQLSLPYVLWEAGIEPVTLPGSVWGEGGLYRLRGPHR